MALHALQDVGDAVTVTREFLFPFDLGRWLKLAVVAFFVGGGVSFPTTQFDSTGTPGQVPNGGEFPVESLVPVIVALILVGLLFAAAFAIIGAIMEFVFVEALRSGDVTIRRYWSRRWRQGIRLFGFRVAIGLPVLAVVLAWLAVLLVPFLTGGGATLPIALFVLGLPVVLLLGLVYALVSSFTTVFVVPIMITEDTGVLTAWRLLWPSVKSEWKQYLAYALVGFGLTIATGLLASFAIGVLAVAVLIPLGILAVVTYLTVSFSTTLGLAIVGVLVVVFVLAMVVLWAAIQVPVVAYLRYYALLVLGDVEPSFDLIPDRRRAVRE